MNDRQNMNSFNFYKSSRRGFLTQATAGILLFTTSGAFAEELMRTPELEEGPFYPDKMPLDKDNDLIIIGKSLTPAVGEITHLRGRILDYNGNPVKNATVEIWQCDAKEVYIHTSDSIPKAAQRDNNFQGFGQFETGSKGEYYFRTIKPVPYPGRPAPHIHFKVKKGGHELITTQMMIRGFKGNKSDQVFTGAGDIINRELVLASFKPKKGSKIGELTANFDIVLGRTPSENALNRNDHFDHHA